MENTSQFTTAAATPVVLPPRSTNDLHAHLLRAILANPSEGEVRQSLRQTLVDATSAHCAMHLSEGENDFAFSESESDGTVPDPVRDSLHVLPGLARQVTVRQSTQVKPLGENHQLICAPVNEKSVLAIIISPAVANLQRSIFSIEIAASYNRLWSRGSVAAANQWKLNSLAAIVELVTLIEQETDLTTAATVAVNEAKKYLNCARVALAFCDGQGIRLAAISGMADIDRNSQTCMLIRESMAESLNDGGLSSWPSDDDCVPLMAHGQLAKQLHFSWVVASPLINLDGKVLGVWLLGDSERVRKQRLENFVRAASPRIASALHSVRRGSRSTVQRIKDRLREVSRSGRLKVGLIGIAMVAGVMLIPVPYRVRCNCIIEPVTKRFAVAPFNGMVDQAMVDAGDVVGEGTLLAKMDGREIRWDLSSAKAQRQQSLKNRDVELAQRNVSEVLIRQLEAQQLAARIDVLQHRAEHLEIRASQDGIVLNGSIDKGQSAPVKTGDVLFEIGSLDELLVEIEVPAEEVAQIAEQQQVKIWIDGLETDPIVGTVLRINPRSEMRRERNVFVAKVSLDNSEKLFRPGMRGSARVNGHRRALGWNLFHKVWEFSVSRLTWW